MKATNGTTRTNIFRKLGYSLLASSLVLSLSPAGAAVADVLTADDGANVLAAADATEVTASTTFTFTNDAITASGEESGYKIDGTELSITASGVYEVTGSCAKGQISVKKGVEDVTIILNGITLANDGDKTIKFKAGSSGTLILKGNNTLSSSNDKGIIKANAAEDDNGNVVTDENGKVSGGSLTITGSGTLNLSSTYSAVVDGETEGCDAINCEGDLTVLGGTYNIDVTDDGMHADYVLTIGEQGSETGPSITIANCEEGLEGATVNLYSGTGSITSSDDGVNAANKDLWVAQGSESNYQYALNIAGGTWTVNAEGDGLDSNGDLTISGGTTVVYGSTAGGNGSLDYGEGREEGEVKGTFTYSGGTLLAIGSDMAVVPDSGTYVSFGTSGRAGGGFGGGMQGGLGGRMGGMRGGMQGAQQGGVSQGTSAVSISKGQTVSITDESGNVIYSTTALKGGTNVVFASDSLTGGSTYKLVVDGAETASATASTGSQQGSDDQQGGQPGNGTTLPTPPSGEQGDGQQPGTPPTGEQGDGTTPPTPPSGEQGDGTTPPTPPSGEQGTDQPSTGEQPATPPTGEQGGGEQSGSEQTGTGANTGTETDTDTTADTDTATTTETVGKTYTAGSKTSKATYKVVSLASATSTGTVTYVKSKSTSKTSATVPASVKINGTTYKVTGIAAKAFKGTKVKTVTVKSANLTKASVKNSLAGSKVSTIKVKVASKKKANKAYVNTYKKIFKKANSGKKVTVK